MTFQHALEQPLMDGLASKVRLDANQQHDIFTDILVAQNVSPVPNAPPFAIQLYKANANGRCRPKEYVVADISQHHTVQPLAIISNRRAQDDIPMSMNVISAVGELVRRHSTEHLAQSIFTNPSLKKAMAGSNVEYSLLVSLTTIPDEDGPFITHRPLLIVPSSSEPAIGQWETNHTFYRRNSLFALPFDVSRTTYEREMGISRAN